MQLVIDLPVSYAPDELVRAVEWARTCQRWHSGEGAVEAVTLLELLVRSQAAQVAGKE